MKNILKQLIKSFIPEKHQSLFRASYRSLVKSIYNPKYIFYKTLDDKKYNEKTLDELGIDCSLISNSLQKYKLNYNDNHLSWHYHLFIGLKHKFELEKKSINNILEIGTDKGLFTSFLSDVFSESDIYSIDLNESDQTFLDYFNRRDPSVMKAHLKERSINLKNDNIIFKEMNSSEIVNQFKEDTFDLIWIDGNHLAPQVNIDIINSIRLSKLNSIVCVDDILFKENFRKTDYISNQYTSNDSYQALELLTNQKYLETKYILKRITRDNAITKKFISISTILKNI
tara:strand:- start:566 stop:1420 length:855 start_codon:yes stop_codon:yes gene_type:complete